MSGEATTQATREASEEFVRRAEAQKTWKSNWNNLSNFRPKILYTPADVEGLDYGRDLGNPGDYPFTRGPHPTMYRGQLWTMRQFAGFGTASDTNKRYKYLLQKGQTGLSVAFDMPTLMGLDSDHARSLGEVGREGVAICTLHDMQTLFGGIDLGAVSTSMTINSPAAILLAFYVVAAEKQGVAAEKLRGTTQNDILKEYQAQKEYIFPPKPSMRLVVDSIAFCTEKLPKWNPVSISGYHIREAGATAVQELAFTLANGFAYVEACVAAGQDIDAFSPRLSFFFNAHLNFFEELAKYRAARRIWARHMKERYGAKKAESWRLRFHTQTAGCSLTAQQPENNIVRTALQALSAVLGGTQSLHTNSYDEALALPTEKAVKVALRTQQIIAHETGVADVVDPLAGSYYVEALTNHMEREAEAYFKRIEEHGGVIPAIERGFFQREISRAAFQYQKEVEDNERVIVGVNDFVEPEEQKIEILRIGQKVEDEQVQTVREIRERRDNVAVKGKLEAIRVAARDGSNLMPRFIEAARVHATLGEMVDVLRAEFGEFREPPTYW